MSKNSIKSYISCYDYPEIYRTLYMYFLSIILWWFWCNYFSDIYGDGIGLCNTLWWNSFVYSNESSSDTDRQCLTLWWPLNDTNPNDVAIRNIFKDQVDIVTPAPCMTDSGYHSIAYYSITVILVVIGKVLITFL